MLKTVAAGSILALFLLPVISSAQDLSRENIFSLKPALGLNGCQVHGDSYDGYNKVGLFTGVAINARLKKNKTSIEMGFYFSQKGSKHVPSKNDPSQYRLHMNYVDIPLLVSYKVKYGYFVTLGPSLGYLISYTENRNYSDETGFYNYNRLEAGVNIGLGKAFKNNFSCELRCTNSVSTVRTIPAKIYYPNPVARFFNRGYYNNLLSLFVSYHLHLKKNNVAK